MIARVVQNWEHDFRTGTVRVYVLISDDAEGTAQVRMSEYPATVLPPALATWEQNIAISKGATLASPQVGS